MKDMIYAVLSSLEKRPCTPDSIYKAVAKNPKKLLAYQSSIRYLKKRGMIKYNGLFSDMHITSCGIDHLDKIRTGRDLMDKEERRYILTTAISVITLLLAVPAFILTLTQLIG